MTAARTAKASRLSELGGHVGVPEFHVVARQAPTPRLSGGKWIVRGCAGDEDGASTSRAGRSPTVGPVLPGAIGDALELVFGDPCVLECIVQRWVDGPSGVALTLPDGTWLVEVARGYGSVTGGRGIPFCAILPNEFPRYRALGEGLGSIGLEWGAVDVEFVGLESPNFVQVRPLTREVTFDRELVLVRQAVQEWGEPEWIQDDFCVDLMERPGIDGATIELFCRTVADTYERCTGRRPQLGARPFVKIGRQLFRNASLGAEFRGTPWQAFRVGWGGAGVLSRVERLVEDPRATPEELMSASIELNLHAELPIAAWPGRRSRLFSLRERCRARMAELLPRESMTADVACSRRLDPVLRLDVAALQWKRCRWFEGVGVDVVAGVPAGAPVQVYDGSPERVREGVVLHTPELYPELADALPRVAGIVCAGGGINSHLAILCREAGLPLRIQVGDEGLAPCVAG